MHIYRSHNCGVLRRDAVGHQVRLSGWVDRLRDHGGLLFLDLRDTYGLTQCVIDVSNAIFKDVESVSLESVVTVDGTVRLRTHDTVNLQLATGAIEVRIEKLTVLSAAKALPFSLKRNGAQSSESLRLTYRFLDLRRKEMQKNIILRSNVIAALRRRMIASCFTEFQTPILTASSPEGARDFVVPSRLHPGKFYALPQAPQQFKQLLMIGGFDRYFQIAPCFRDEDARADRSPGEFYQLDFEMAFATQEDVFAVLEPVLYGTFEEFAKNKCVMPPPFPRIPYAKAMVTYGTDKPDLRNPLEMADVSDIFAKGEFKLFSTLIARGGIVRAIPAPKAGMRPRSFFDRLNSWARSNGQAGLGYIQFQNGRGALGPIAKNLDSECLEKIKKRLGVTSGDAVFFVCGIEKDVVPFSGLARMKIAEELEIMDRDAFAFCWIVDFPLYTYDENAKRIVFSHNPFSMPQGGMEALNTKEPLDILAYQYDIVCNGIEISSGAIRNHLLDVMYKSFHIAGYSQESVEEKFPAMIEALSYGAPPHGGAAPGIDRIVMLLAGASNIRQVIAFPLSQMGEDLMLKAPAKISQDCLKDAHIAVTEDISSSES